MKKSLCAGEIRVVALLRQMANSIESGEWQLLDHDHFYRASKKGILDRVDFTTRVMCPSLYDRPKAKSKSG